MSGAGMVRLAVSASGDVVHCALELASGEQLAASGAPRSDDLLPLVAGLFAQSATPRTHLRELLLDVGPGSYTGLRCAVAFARTLAREQPLVLRTASSLLLHASAARRELQPERDTVHVLLDARRGRWHHAAFSGGDLAARHAPAALAPQDAIGRLRHGAHVLAAAALHDTIRAGAPPGITLAALPPWDATALFAIAPLLQASDAQQLEPLYLMGSYAEP